MLAGCGSDDTKEESKSTEADTKENTEENKDTEETKEESTEESADQPEDVYKRQLQFHEPACLSHWHLPVRSSQRQPFSQWTHALPGTENSGQRYPQGIYSR